MLTIPVGHTLAALCDVLGNIDTVSARLARRRTQVLALDTGEMLPMTAPDQVLISGLLANGAPLAIHYRGGLQRGAVGLVWDINGACTHWKFRRRTWQTARTTRSLAMWHACMPGWRRIWPRAHGRPRVSTTPWRCIA
jgi:hypothetical protein